MWSSQYPEICQWGRNLERKKHTLGHPKGSTQSQMKKKFHYQPTCIQETKLIFGNLIKSQIKVN